MKPTLLVADDLAEAATAVFLDLAPRTVSLAGGNTPRAFYERLAGTPHPWEDVDVFFGDERCVPPDHPDSNFAMANEALLAHVPARAHPMDGERCDADAYERELRAILGDRPSLDLAILGLGTDGHTASLFPGDPSLTEKGRLVVRVPKPGQEPPHPRLTMTLPMLSAARAAMFLVEGEAKRPALRALLEGSDIPAARVAAARTIVVATGEVAAGL